MLQPSWRRGTRPVLLLLLSALAGCVVPRGVVALGDSPGGRLRKGRGPRTVVQEGGETSAPPRIFALPRGGASPPGHHLSSGSSATGEASFRAILPALSSASFRNQGVDFAAAVREDPPPAADVGKVLDALEAARGASAAGGSRSNSSSEDPPAGADVGKVLDALAFTLEIFAASDLNQHLNSPMDFCFYRAMAMSQKRVLVEAFEEEVGPPIASAFASIQPDLAARYEGLPSAEREKALARLQGTLDTTELAAELAKILAKPVEDRLGHTVFRPDSGGITEGTKAGAHKLLTEEMSGLGSALAAAAGEVATRVNTLSLEALS